MAMNFENLRNYVRRCVIEMVQWFMLLSNNPGLIDYNGKKQLHYAAESDDIPMMAHLMKNNHDFNILDNHGNSPLKIAVAKNNCDIALLLVKAGADINNLCSDDAARILSTKSRLVSKYYLKSYEYYKVVKIILDKLRKDCHNDEHLLFTKLLDFGCSLIQVIRLGDSNLTRLMLENGFSVDERESQTQRTALYYAVQFEDFQNVKLLLDFGASVGALDPFPPLLSSGILFDYSRNCDTDDGERLKIMKIMIEHGALSVEIPSEDFMTSVELICRDGDLRTITALMECGVDLTYPKAVENLVFNDNDGVLELLRGMKFNVNLDVNYFTLLSISVLSNTWKMTQFLLERGADPNAVDKSGGTALEHIIVEVHPSKNVLAQVRLLLQYGADVQCAFYNGEETIFDLSEPDFIATLSIFEYIIAHLAVIDSVSDIGITDLIRRKILSKESLETQFKKCKQQLKTMKETTIYGSVTIFKLLTETQARIIKYARNQEFADKFRKNMKIIPVLESYYSISLKLRVGKAIYVAKLKEEAVVEMSKFFVHRISNFREILSEIVNYLNYDDLINISRVNNFEELESFHLDKLFL